MNFDATSANGAPLNCIVCDREIPGGNWFARIKLGGSDGRVALCRPQCAEIFEDNRETYDHKAGFVASITRNRN